MSKAVLQTRERDMSLDILKGILTFFVITTHMVSFFPFLPYNYITARLINIYVVYTCLMTFSCFMLILGYMSYKAYLSRSMGKLALGKKLLKNFVKTIATYYVSALAYTIFIKQSLDWPMLADILLFRYVVEYCEFILSFAFIYVIVFLFDKSLGKLNKAAWLILVALSLASTFIPYERISVPLVGVFTGTTAFSSFSIFQYFCYFITGVYFAKTGLRYNKWLLLCSAVPMAAFIAWRIILNDYPTRFPPSFLWVAGGALLVYCALLIVRHIPINGFTKLLAVMGKDSLYYMLFSNIVLFALRRLTILMEINPTGLLLIFFYILTFALCVAAARAYTILKASLKKLK